MRTMEISLSLSKPLQLWAPPSGTVATLLEKFQLPDMPVGWSIQNIKRIGDAVPCLSLLQGHCKCKIFINKVAQPNL